MAVKLILIRHGESEGNAKRQFSGSQNVNLTDQGIKQAERLAFRLRKVSVDEVYCSDLRRAQHTAEIIFKNHQVNIISNSNFREINFGAWEGYTFEEVMARYGKNTEIKLWMTNLPEEVHFPEGESLSVFNKRVMGELNKIIGKDTQKEISKTIALVVHGGTIRVILCNALKINLKYMWNIEQHSTALNIIHYYEGQAFVRLINDTTHLEDWWVNQQSGLNL
ncbi:MAG: alpha-ribazole phosphatase [Candidatus Caldatribacteriota bacterium]